MRSNNIFLYHKLEHNIMKCFYDFDYITHCPNCNNKINSHECCDNACGSFECDHCKKEFYAQYTNDLSNTELKMMTTQKYYIIETKRGFIIICEGHNSECGEFD